MSVARNTARVRVPPERVVAAWTDLERWPAFIEGFARFVERDERWPAAGARVVWESIPEGRGRVSERVAEHGAVRFSVEVEDDQLEGVQTLSAEPDTDGGSLLRLELDYRLLRPGPLGPVTDALFIRRALAAALGRTLDRFAAEASQPLAER